MPLKPNLIERLLIRHGIIPSALLDVEISLFQSSAILTAGDIRLFNHQENAPLTLEDLTEKTHCSAPGLHVLPTALINLGYVKKKG